MAKMVSHPMRLGTLSLHPHLGLGFVRSANRPRCSRRTARHKYYGASPSVTKHHQASPGVTKRLHSSLPLFGKCEQDEQHARWRRRTARKRRYTTWYDEYKGKKILDYVTTTTRTYGLGLILEQPHSWIGYSRFHHIKTDLSVTLEAAVVAAATYAAISYSKSP